MANNQNKNSKNSARDKNVNKITTSNTNKSMDKNVNKNASDRGTNCNRESDANKGLERY